MKTHSPRAETLPGGNKCLIMQPTQASSLRNHIKAHSPCAETLVLPVVTNKCDHGTSVIMRPLKQQNVFKDLEKSNFLRGKRNRVISYFQECHIIFIEMCIRQRTPELTQ